LCIKNAINYIIATAAAREKNSSKKTQMTTMKEIQKQQ